MNALADVVMKMNILHNVIYFENVYKHAYKTVIACVAWMALTTKCVAVLASAQMASYVTAKKLMAIVAKMKANVFQTTALKIFVRKKISKIMLGVLSF